MADTDPIFSVEDARVGDGVDLYSVNNRDFRLVVWDYFEANVFYLTEAQAEALADAIKDELERRFNKATENY